MKLNLGIVDDYRHSNGLFDIPIYIEMHYNNGIDIWDVYLTIRKHRCCTCTTLLPITLKNDATTTILNTFTITYNSPFIICSQEINCN